MLLRRNVVLLRRNVGLLVRIFVRNSWLKLHLLNISISDSDLDAKSDRIFGSATPPC